MPLVEPPDSPEFVMTVGSRRTDLKPHIENGDITVMRNVMQYRRADGLGVKEPYAGKYVLDSGGYTAMNEFGGDFPWTVQEYHDWAAEMYELAPFEWVAAMDLACEPAFDDDMTVRERMTQTVDNTVRLLDLNPKFPVLPVLQGRTISQWLESYDMLRDRGIDPDYAGIGTLCRQSSGEKIKRIVRAIRTQTDIDAFHGFGVKSTAFKSGAQLETADSQAWCWPVKFGLCLDLDDSTPPKLVRTEYDDVEGVHVRSFQAYYEHVSRLQREAYDSQTQQQSLATYG